MAYKYLICLHCLENNDKKKKVHMFCTNEIIFLNNFNLCLVDCTNFFGFVVLISLLFWLFKFVLRSLKTMPPQGHGIYTCFYISIFRLSMELNVLFFKFCGNIPGLVPGRLISDILGTGPDFFISSLV